MKIKSTIISIFMQLILTLAACGQAPEITVTIAVLDEHSESIKWADIRTGYIRPEGGHRVIEGKTNDEGIFRFNGRPGEHSISARIRKDGYYDSEKRFSVARSVQGYAVNSDTEVSFILREIRNPVAMMAGRTRIEFPESEGSLKYDLMKRDWLPPHGSGKTADLVVHFDFMFNEWLDHDMQVTWEFIGETNGIQPFEPVQESAFISPYTAPLDGYQSDISWRNRRFENEGWTSSTNRYHVEYVNDLLPGGDARGEGQRFYLFRIRSEIDENGEIIGGHYGKIYGFGMMLRPDGEFPGGHHTGVVYLNPNIEDRNIEMDLETNLLKDLPRFYEPRRP